MATHISHAGLPYPIRGARFSIPLVWRDDTGDLANPATSDMERSVDGAAYADCTEEATTVGTGTGYHTFTGDETTCSLLFFQAKDSDGAPTAATTPGYLQPRILPVVSSGTAQAGAAGTITLAAGAPAYSLVGAIVKTTGGTGGGGGSGNRDNQARLITAYNTSTKVATVVPNWETTPDNTTTYEVLLTDVAANAIFANLTSLSGDEGAADSLEATLDGTGAAIKFTTMTVTGQLVIQDGIDVSCATTDRTGIVVAGNGTGGGVKIDAGATGVGLRINGGATSGHGVRIDTTSGSALRLIADSGGGINISSNSGIGIEINTGSTGVQITSATEALYLIGTNYAARFDGRTHFIWAGGTAVTMESGGSNGVGLSIIGNGSGAGLKIAAGATGIGLDVDGGATSGAAATFNTTSGVAVAVTAGGGNAAGLTITGQGSGNGVTVTPGATGSGVAISGGATSGAALSLSNTSGNCVNIAATSGHGISSQGGGTGNGFYIGGGTSDAAGLLAAGGGTGAGMRLSGGSGGGVGLLAIGTSDNAGVNISGNGAGGGLVIAGGATGIGLSVSGGVTSGVGMAINSYGSAGMTIVANGGNNYGLQLQGSGSADGFRSDGGATGMGMRLVGGATSGAALHCTNTTGDVITVVAVAGNGDAIQLTPHGTGYGINGTMTWTAAWDAEVESEVTDALNTYDPPTNAEMVARTLAAADYATATALDTVDNLVDDLESRIGTPSNLGSGATVAANLVDIESQTDDIGVAGAGLTALAPASTALSTTQWTNARAGYLDNLNIGGNVASSTEVTSIQNNTRVVRVVPTIVERPDSGTVTHRIELLLYDTVGNMEAPDSAPTIALVDQDGTDLSARLDSTTMALVSTGRYRAIYTASSTDDLEQLIWAFSVIEGGATRIYGNTTQIVDTTAVDFTTADRTKLEAVYNKLPSKSYLAGSSNSDGDVQLDEATGALTTTHVASVWSVVARTLTAADNITSTGGTITVSSGSVSVYDFTTAAKALLEAEATDALNAYDPPTNAEMVARTLAAADYATAANQTTIIADIAAVPADAATAIFDTEVDTGYTFMQATQLIAAASAGELSGSIELGTGDTTEIEIMNLAGDTVWITATVDEFGNRQTVTHGV